MPVSIKDIAKQAGVSPSTVSRALNDHPRISDDTKLYIQQLAKEMGYVPSIIARSLVAQRSATIGVAITDLADPYYVDLMVGIEAAAEAHNYQVILSSFYRDPDRELAVVYDFHQRRADGIIITGSYVENAYLSPDNNFFKPIVVINSLTYPYSVSVDRVLGVKQIIEHLIALRHKRIAHVAQLRDGLDRLEGYRSALSEYNLPIDESLIILCEGGIVGGVKAVPELLNNPNLPTAIFCFNDLTAIGVINALRERGYQVPQDISVVGFDDLALSAYYHPALTTIHQPSAEVGKRAVEMLVRLMNGDKNVTPEVMLPKLVIRQSTAPVTGEINR
jgi:DNA-binding LacI/PurR family transcriptional regulator